MDYESLISSTEETCRLLKDWQIRSYEKQFGLPASTGRMDWETPTFHFQGFVQQKKML